jgi:hypothetical protein
MTTKQQLIISAIDNAIDFSDKVLRGLNHVIGAVPPYMVDNTKKMDNFDWVYWKPAKAEIKGEDFNLYEEMTGIPLPESYVMFLSHIHFIDLNFGHDIIFFPHTKDWINTNYEIIEGWGPDITVKKGLLPFADVNDWGIACFDSNTQLPDDEYDIVYLDHEDLKNPKRFKRAPYSFIELIQDMNQTLNTWRQTKIADG